METTLAEHARSSGPSAHVTSPLVGMLGRQRASGTPTLGVLHTGLVHVGPHIPDIQLDAERPSCTQGWAAGVSLEMGAVWGVTRLLLRPEAP